MNLSRRDVLGVLLGAPLAAEACRKPARRFPGEIRGGAVTFGHRLRDASVERAGGSVVEVDVAIVGAGPSGLCAAWRLERLGQPNFVVLDLEAQAGGTSSYGGDGVVPYPWGAHYLPLPGPENRALWSLLDEIGLPEPAPGAALPLQIERALVREPEERLYIDGGWQEGLFPASGASPADFAELRRFEAEMARWSRYRDERGRRAFVLPVDRCSDAAECTALDKLTAARWLDDNGFRSRRLRWYLEYACRDDYGLTLAQTSAWALLFYFAARQTAHGDSAPFLAWPEGNGRLVRHLTSVVGTRLRLGQLVTDVVPGEQRVELAVLDQRGELVRYLARHAILAVPKFVARHMFRPFRERPPALLQQFSYGAWLVANLHLSRRPRSRGAELAWDNVIYDSPSLGYVVATHQALKDRGPTIFTYYLPLTDEDPDRARQKLLALDHAAASDAVVADLGRAHRDLEDVIERIDVWRWGHAMVRPVPGLIWSDARRRARAPIGRVHFAHADLSGLALFEEAQAHGIRAAEEIAQRRSVEFAPLSG